jgi:hypothetical protein
MKLALFVRTRQVLAASTTVVLAVSAPALAQQEGARPGRDATPPSISTRKAAPTQERASGVILKVEKIQRNVTTAAAPTGERVKAANESPYTHRLTININAVWRDWARDQARLYDSGPPSKDAAKGNNSVATKGEPADRNNLVVIDIGPETRVETRFRAPDDETTKGSRTPESVRSGAPKDETSRQSAKPVQFRLEDLKPGLFVEVDFRHLSGQNPATTVTVIRPIGQMKTPSSAGDTARDRSK